MLVQMLKGKDLFYPGEITQFPDDFARQLIADGVAQEYRCPECCGQLEDAGSAVYCRECGYRRWKE